MTSSSLREHARGAVRAEVLRQAWLLFADHGFEATTVDQIADAAGMSRRTFFRYFESKDELVLARLVEAGERVAAALAGRPAGEPVWTALRRAFDVLVVPQEEHAEQSRRLQQMLHDEPGTRASVLERRRRWLDLLTPLAAERMTERRTGREPDVRAAATVACALACLEIAQGAWAEHPQARLGVLLDQSMAAMRPHG